MTVLHRALLLAALTVLGAFAGADEPARQTYKLDIAAQPVGDALNEFARQSGLQVVIDPQEGAGVSTARLTGTFTTDEALKRLLANTGLGFEYLNARTVAVRPARAKDTPSPKLTGTGGELPQQDLQVAQATAPADTPSNASVSATAGNGVVSGRVIDGSSGKGLAGALVRIEETGQTTTTDGLGEFRMTGVQPGGRTVAVFYLGYAAVSAKVDVRDAENYSVDFVLTGANEVTVFGQRSSQALALNQERTAENSTTVVSADMLGNFTGTTISDALRRVPGVAFQRNENGDGRNIILRGLEPDFNQVTLNGMVLPEGSGTGRSADLSNILADAVSKVTISKTLLPSQDSAGTGGLVEIETKSPLERPRRFAAFGAENLRRGGNFGEDYLASATLSGRFGAEENFGLSASAQYRSQDIARSRYNIGTSSLGQYLPLERDGSTAIDSASRVDPRLAYPLIAGVDGYYADSLTISDDRQKKDTLALAVSGAWRIGEQTTLRMDLLHFASKSDSVNRALSLMAPSSYTPQPVPALGGETRQVLNWSGAVLINQVYNWAPDRKAVTDSFSLRGTSQAGNWTFDYLAGRSRGYEIYPDSYYASINNAASGALDPSLVAASAYDPAIDSIPGIFGARRGSAFPLPLLTAQGFAFLNTESNYGFGSSSHSSKGRGENIVDTGDLSARYTFDRSPVKYVDIGVSLKSSRFSDARGDEDGVLGLPDSIGRTPSVASLGQAFESIAIADAGGGNGSFRMLGFDGMKNLFISLPQLAQSNPNLMASSFQYDPAERQTYTQEDDRAAYVQGRMDIGKLEIIGGARLSRVEVEAAFVSSPNYIDETFTEDLAFKSEFTRIVHQRATQTDVLPRLLMNYRQSDNLVFRAGYYASVARPQIGQLSSEQTIIFFDAPLFGPNSDQPILRVFQGNPDLKPAYTDSYDFSAEYYSAALGAIKLGLFYKRIENLLESNQQEGFTALDGVVLPDHPYFDDLSNVYVLGQMPLNNPTPAKIHGVESSVQRQLTFLPGLWSGLGVYFNYTYTDSSKDQPASWFASPVFDSNGNFAGLQELNFVYKDIRFDQQPRHSGTAGLTYNKHGIDASLFYSMQSRVRSGFMNNNLHMYEESADSLDLRLEYLFRRAAGQYRVYLEGADLLRGSSDPNSLRSAGGEGGTPRYYIGGNFLGGRTVALGLAVTF